MGDGIEVLAIALKDRQAFFTEGGETFHIRKIPGRNIITESRNEVAGIACAKHGYEPRSEFFDDRDSLSSYLDREMIKAYESVDA